MDVWCRYAATGPDGRQIWSYFLRLGEDLRRTSDHQLTIWERKDCPSTFTKDRLTPVMSSMVGARSIFSTGAWGSHVIRRQNKTRHVLVIFTVIFLVMEAKNCVCVCRTFVDLQRLIRFDSRTTNHKWDPDVKFIQLPLINGQRELTWEEWRQMIIVKQFSDHLRRGFFGSELLRPVW